MLFFTRIGADTLGRFTPRIKTMVTHSPSTLLTLATAEVSCNALGLLGRWVGVLGPWMGVLGVLGTWVGVLGQLVGALRVGDLTVRQ